MTTWIVSVRVDAPDHITAEQLQDFMNEALDERCNLENDDPGAWNDGTSRMWYDAEAFRVP
jgi:hypothetical protein